MRYKILGIAGLVGLLAFGTAGASGPNYAQDRANAGANAMPTGVGVYGTNVDNENNAGTHVSDGDMGGTGAPCVYNSRGSANSPIEFNITLPSTAANLPGVLHMNVYDVDVLGAAGYPVEADTVWVNGANLGTLTGGNNIWGINYFNIPPMILKSGLNTVRIIVDTKSTTASNWCVAAEWGTITVAASNSASQILRAWVTPVGQTKGQYVNFFAETQGAAFAKVSVFSGATKLLDLIDKDLNKVWSGQYYLPAATPTGNLNINMKGYNASGVVTAIWPAISVK
jgi:hypothetical protein